MLRKLFSPRSWSSRELTSIAEDDSPRIPADATYQLIFGPSQSGKKTLFHALGGELVSGNSVRDWARFLTESVIAWCEQPTHLPPPPTIQPRYSFSSEPVYESKLEHPYIPPPPKVTHRKRRSSIFSSFAGTVASWKRELMNSSLTVESIGELIQTMLQHATVKQIVNKHKYTHIWEWSVLQRLELPLLSLPESPYLHLASKEPFVPTSSWMICQSIPPLTGKTKQVANSLTLSRVVFLFPLTVYGDAARFSEAMNALAETVWFVQQYVYAHKTKVPLRVLLTYHDLWTKKLLGDDMRQHFDEFKGEYTDDTALEFLKDKVRSVVLGDSLSRSSSALSPRSTALSPRPTGVSLYAVDLTDPEDVWASVAGDD